MKARRRTMLIGTVVSLLAAGGCGIGPESGKFNIPSALTGMLDSARQLHASYAQAIDSGAPQTATLEMLRDNHAAHIEALVRILGADPDKTSSAVDGLGDDVLAALLKAEESAASNALATCANATEDFVVFTGEIAACLSCHVDVLEELS